MIIYNVTIQVAHAIAENWLPWMQQVHIPEVMATGCFEKFQLVKLLDTDESEGITYAVQYYAPDLPQCEAYLDKYAPMLRKKVSDTWGDQVFAFRSLMEVIH
jgi:hypothetical protein